MILSKKICSNKLLKLITIKYFFKIKVFFYFIYKSIINLKSYAKLIHLALLFSAYGYDDSLYCPPFHRQLFVNLFSFQHHAFH